MDTKNKYSRNQDLGLSDYLSRFHEKFLLFCGNDNDSDKNKYLYASYLHS